MPTASYVLKEDRFSSHSKIAALLRAQAQGTGDSPYVVLDLGCAAGFLRNFMPAPDFYLVGVERDPDYAALARQSYDEVHQAGLAPDLVIPLQRQPHAIVLADVLEHLVDPAATLSGILKTYAHPGTEIVISLPNFAHLYVRLHLLFGRFDYADHGLLDRTHLRFYTLKTARQLLADCHIRIETVDVTPVPLPLISARFGEGQPLFAFHALNHRMARVFRTLLAYQFIFRGHYVP
jgi:SAM-dependent methyltransferase